MRTKAAATRLEPAQFLVTFARAMIDAGADLFVGHGPHVLRGIEIYKGAPIIYSLGDFIFQNETLLRLSGRQLRRPAARARRAAERLPQPRYNFDKSGFPADPPIWESVVAMPRFRAAGWPSWRCTRSRSASAAPATCAAGRCWRRRSWARRS